MPALIPSSVRASIICEIDGRTNLASNSLADQVTPPGELVDHQRARVALHLLDEGRSDRNGVDRRLQAADVRGQRESMEPEFL
jgi:hypothetical protein